MKRILILITMVLLSITMFGCGDDHEHNWGNWKDSFDGITHTRICKDDYSHKEKNNHRYDDVLVIKEVSDLQNGIIKYTCVDCGYNYQKILPPTGSHNFTEEIADDNHLYKNVSSATKIYYKSCSDCGAYGNEEFLFEKTELPSDYLEIEYLMSTGEQFIDTKFKANSDTHIIFKCSYSSNYSLYGGTPSYLNFTATSTSAVGYFYYSGYGSGASPQGNFANNVHVFEQDKNVCFVDGEEYYTFDYVEWQDENNLYLFARNNDGTMDDAGGNIKLYYCQIFDDGELIRDYVPVMNLDTYKYGLYDLVTKEFFTNGCEFKYGEIKQDGILPEGYRQVEYIESNGNQIIDTEVDTYNKWEFDIQFTVDGSRQLMGYGGSGSEYWGVQKDGTYGVQLGHTLVKAGNRDIVIHDYESSNKYIAVNGNIIQPVGYTEITKSYKLFALSDYLSFSCKAKLYGCKSWHDGVLVRNFIPCINENTKEVGLFDLVTNKFYQSKMKEDFKGGDISGHDFGEGIILADRTYYQDGEILLYCKVCGKQLHKYEEKYSHEVKFKYDEGVESIKIFKDYNPEVFEYSDTAYTRNRNTFNYSKVDGIVILEVVLKEDYIINTSYFSDVSVTVSKVENRYILSNINCDLEIEITTILK